MQGAPDSSHLAGMCHRFLRSDGCAWLRLAACVALAASAGSAQDTALFPAPVVRCDDRPSTVVTADFNGDGHLDLAAPNDNAELGTVSLMLGLGDGSFPAAVSLPFTMATYPLDLAAADVNGDGQPDLTTVDEFGLVFVELGHGDGTFTYKSTFNGALNAAEALAAGDFDDDGDPDFMVSVPIPASVAILGNQGDGILHGIGAVSIPGGAGHIVTADFDVDGNLDALVGCVVTPPVVLLGSGNGSFTTDALSGLPGTWPRAVAAPDLDDDGCPDVAFAAYKSDLVVTALGDGLGNFALAGTVGVGQEPVALVAGDFDGDLHADLASVDLKSNTVTVLRGAGNGTVTKAAAFGGVSNPLGLVAADLDADGRTDLAVANGFADTVTILLRNGPDSFAGNRVLPVAGGPDAIAVGDFDLDGHADLGVANATTNSVQILRGVGDGAFTAGVSCATGAAPAALVVADFNEDGKPDLASANSLANTVSILVGHGNGTFTNGPSGLTVGDHPDVMVVADFDGDANQDLAVGASGINPDTITILLGHGNLTFTKAGTITVPNDPRGLVSGDFDGDGNADLAVTTSAAGGLRILFGLGTGSFLAPQTVDAGAGVVGLAVADLDLDGRLDLATTNDGATDAVTILHGLPLGSFSVAGQWALPDAKSPLVIHAADIQVDGKPDLVLADDLTDFAAIFVGQGDGTFLDGGRYGTATNPVAIAVADLDEDGALDIATANKLSGSVSILLNASAPTWKQLGYGLAGVSGVANLAGSGTLAYGAPGEIDLTNAKPSAASLLFVSLSSAPLAFKGGTLIAFPSLIGLPLSTLPDGTVPLPFTWPAGIPSGTSLWFQLAIADAAAIHGVALSEALRATTP